MQYLECSRSRVWRVNLEIGSEFLERDYTTADVGKRDKAIGEIQTEANTTSKMIDDKRFLLVVSASV